MHPHAPSLHVEVEHHDHRWLPDEEGSPWRLLPAVVLFLALVNTLMILGCFAIADLVTGHAY